MRHAASLRLHAYWDALRAGRPAPERDEIDPAAIRDVLASVFMLDVAKLPLPRPADATVRLSGTRLDALFGRTLRGSTFDRLWAPGSAALAADALGAVLDRRRAVLAAASGGPDGRRAIDLELLLLPLGARGCVLGALSTAVTPEWMGLCAAAPLDILPSAGCRPDGSRRTFGRRAARSFAVVPGGRCGPAALSSP
jgi:hypothetical protein